MNDEIEKEVSDSSESESVSDPEETSEDKTETSEDKSETSEEIEYSSSDDSSEDTENNSDSEILEHDSEAINESENITLLTDSNIVDTSNLQTIGIFICSLILGIGLAICFIQGFKKHE